MKDDSKIGWMCLVVAAICFIVAGKIYIIDNNSNGAAALVALLWMLAVLFLMIGLSFLKEESK